MTQEDKKLLLKDLCARLPYGIFVKEDNVYDKVVYTYDYHPHIETCKPYLRPMSSMTKEEAKAYLNDIPYLQYIRVDWLNERYFDYRGLIEKGLALEATEDMYKD